MKNINQRLRGFFGSCVLLVCLQATNASAQLTPPLNIPLLSPADSVSANAESLSAVQLQALWRAAMHTRGSSGFVYRSAVYPTEQEAKRVAYSASRGRPFGVREFVVTDLLPVSTLIRPILVDLWLDGEVSEPRQVMLASGSKAWAVVQLIRRTPSQARPNDAAWAEEAPKLLKAGLLPSITQAMSDPQERSRQAFWFAANAAQVAALGREFSPNVKFGAFSTPLSLALIKKDLELLDLLIARGADPNACDIWGCPLSLAISGAATENEAGVMIERLLAAGAKPNQFDPMWSGANRTALGHALRKKYAGLAQRLVSAGANIDGVANVGETPLFSALFANNRDGAKWLLAAGASVLRFPDDRNKYVYGQRSLYSIFTGEYGEVDKKDAEQAQWARELMLAAAIRSPSSAFEAFILQDGVRHALQGAKTLRLKASAFQIEIVYPDAPSTLIMAASLESDWLAQVQNKDTRLPVFRPGNGAATAAVGQQEPPELHLSSMCRTQNNKDENCSGGFQYLTQFDDGSMTFHARRAAERAYIRNINTLHSYDPIKKLDNKLEFAALAGKSLYLLVASPLVLHPISDQELIHPKTIRIDFVRP